MLVGIDCAIECQSTSFPLIHFLTRSFQVPEVPAPRTETGYKRYGTCFVNCTGGYVKEMHILEHPTICRDKVLLFHRFLVDLTNNCFWSWSWVLVLAGSLLQFLLFWLQLHY